MALIITIIVLLILSVVSVQLITKSGIIERAKQGVIKHKLEEIHENVKLSYTSLKLGNNLSVITMSDEIKKLQENKYKKYIEKVNYTSTKVFYKMTDKLDGKEYMIDIKTGEIGTYEDKLQRVEADETLWDFDESTNKIKGYFGTGDLLKNVIVPNVIKKKDGTEVKITNVSLSNINFEGTLTFASGLTINTGTVTNCSTIENIEIGNDVTIDTNRWSTTSAFSYCENLKTVTIGRNIKITDWQNSDNVEYAKWAMFYESGVEQITVESLSEVAALAFYNVSSAIQGNIVINEGVTTIGGGAFKECNNITSVVLPSTITTIGNTAFYNCTSLKTAKLPTGIKSIGESAFYNCTNLSDEVVIGDGATIESSAFNKTGITKVTIGNNITIPVKSFNDCPNLTSVSIGNDVTIDTNRWSTTSAFSYCENLKTVTIGRNIKITDWQNSDNVEYAKWAMFYESGVEQITVESLSEVAALAFYNVSSAIQGNIVINEGVTTIGGGAFKECNNITSVVLPSTITTIGSTAFYNCTGLQTININMTEEEWNAVTKGSNWNTNVTANIVFKK